MCTNTFSVLYLAFMLFLVSIGWLTDALFWQIATATIFSALLIVVLCYNTQLRVWLTSAMLVALRVGSAAVLVLALLLLARRGDSDERKFALSVVLGSVAMLVIALWWSGQLAATTIKRRGVRYVFVHGFNNTEEQVAKRAQLLEKYLEIKDKSDFDVGKWLSAAGSVNEKLSGPLKVVAAALYPLDNWLTQWSFWRKSVLDRLRKRDDDERSVRVVAHSRGCFVTTCCLIDLQEAVDGLAHVERVAFLHPDVDHGTFERISDDFRRAKIAVFDTAHDGATTLSSVFATRDLSQHIDSGRLVRIDKGLQALSHSAHFEEPHVDTVKCWLERGDFNVKSKTN